MRLDVMLLLCPSNDAGLEEGGGAIFHTLPYLVVCAVTAAKGVSGSGASMVKVKAKAKAKELWLCRFEAVSGVLFAPAFKRS